ncbi:MAG: aldehyde dehydrogenase family protein [Bacteroidetes bacterium]|nr:aldehyde dehydrogenase family protein [Bacteroidota bacterium]
MEVFKIYAGGEFIETPLSLLVSNPYNDIAFAQAFLADEKVLQFSSEKAVEAFKKLKSISAYERYKSLSFIASEILANEERFAMLIAQEAAKPWKYALAEVRRAAQTFVVASEECKRLPMEYMRLDWSVEGIGREGLIKYFPIGPIAGISPFNFPLNLAAHKIAPALAAGCPIVLKPASSTPLATLELAKIVDKSGFPKGSMSILPMNRSTGDMLVTSDVFKLLTFTGSSEVGWKMKSRAGKKKVVLELGGNAGTIITDSADISHAAKRCVVGGFAYQGQVCIHAQRLFVHKSVFDDFCAEFLPLVKNLKYGDPLSKDTDITAMIDEVNALRVEEWINEAVRDGAELLCGGKRTGAYVEPTVITNVKPEMKVSCLEIFGPVVTLQPYTDFKEVVDQVNNTNYGLQAGIFTNNIKELDYAFNEIEAGGVIHNDVPVFRTDHMPYGGVKDSGIGREGVKYAIHDMLEPKILVR